jgi:hypothetical protein
MLPKYVTDSCYASLTQIYRDMFELTPKSNLKPASSTSRLSFKSNQQKHNHSTSITSLDREASPNEMPRHPDRKAAISRFLSFGSLKKSASANISYCGDKNPMYYYGDSYNLSGENNSHLYYYGEKERRRSERKFDKNYYYGNYGNDFRKGNKMRASWHEGDTKRSVVGTKIEFVTRF